MISPNCPEHGRLVLDLALGRLDDDDAVRAEEIRSGCPECRSWWQQQFDGGEIARVDEAVASVFSQVELPERRRGRGRLALAAAVVMALGATTLWLAQRPMTQTPEPVEQAAVERVAAIQSMDFEIPAAVRVNTESSDLPVAEIAIDDGAVELIPLKDIVADEIVVAEVVPGEAPVAADSKPLFSGSFEAGDLGEWVPST